MGLPMPCHQNGGSGNPNTGSAGSSNQSVPPRTSFSMKRAFGGLMNIKGNSTASTPGNDASCPVGRDRVVTPSSVPCGEAGVMKHGVVFQSNSSGPKGSSLLSKGGMGRGFSSSKSKELSGVGGGSTGAMTATVMSNRSLPAALIDQASPSMQGGAMIGKNAMTTSSSMHRPSVLTATSNDGTSAQPSSTAASSVALTSRKSFPGRATSLPLSVATSPATVTQGDADPDPRVLDFKTHEAAVGVPNSQYANFSRSSNLAKEKLSTKEVTAIYVRNVPLDLRQEDLSNMFRQHCQVLSIFVKNHTDSAYPTTYAIVKVPSLRDAVHVMESLSDAPPFFLRLSLALTEEEKNKRKMQREGATIREEALVEHVSAREAAIRSHVASFPTPAPSAGPSAGVGRGHSLLKTVAAARPGDGAQYHGAPTVANETGAECAIAAVAGDGRAAVVAPGASTAAGSGSAGVSVDVDKSTSVTKNSQEAESAACVNKCAQSGGKTSDLSSAAQHGDVNLDGSGGGLKKVDSTTYERQQKDFEQQHRQKQLEQQQCSEQLRAVKIDDSRDKVVNSCKPAALHNTSSPKQSSSLTPMTDLSSFALSSISSVCSSSRPQAADPSAGSHSGASAANSANTAPQLSHSSSTATERSTCQEMVSSTATCQLGNVSPRPPAVGHPPCASAVLGLVGAARPRLCVGCGSAAAVRCSVCKAGYCSTDCQHEDWHYHRKGCQPPPPLEEYSFTVLHNNSVTVKQEPLSPPPSSAHQPAQQLFRKERQEPSRPEQEQVAKPQQEVYLLKQWEQLDAGTAASQLPASVDRSNVAEERHQQEAHLLDKRQQLKAGRPASQLPASVDHANVTEQRPQQLKLVPRSVSLSRAGDETKHVAVAAPSLADAPKMNSNVQVSAVKKADVSIGKQDETPAVSIGKQDEAPAVSIGKQNEAPAVVKNDYPVGSAVSGLQLEVTYSAMVTTINNISSFTLLVFVEGTEDILEVGSVQLEDCPLVSGFFPRVGQLVASQSLHDSTWCRSYVFGINDSGYQVCHIDFGYIETVVAVKPVPEGMCSTAPGTGLCAVLDQGANNDVSELALIVKNEGLVHFRVTAAGDDAVTAVVLSEKGRDLGTYLLQSWYEGIASLSAIERTHGVVSICTKETTSPSVEVVQEQNIPTGTVKPIQPESRDDSSRPQQPKAPTMSSAGNDPFSPDAVSSTGQPGAGANNKTRCGVSSSTGGGRGGCFMLGDLKQLSLDLGERYPVMPVWCEQDFLFVQIHTEELVEMFSKLMANICDHCALSSSPDAVKVGELVCGYIEADCLWYRALVVQVDPDSSVPAPVSLYFVDFGSTERVALSNVRPFIRPFLDVPVMCVKVALCGDAPKKGAPHEQLTDVYEILKDLVEVSGQLLMRVVANNADQSVVAGGPPQLESLLVKIFDKDGLLCVNDTVLCMVGEPPRSGGSDSEAVAQHQGKEEVVVQGASTVAPGVGATHEVTAGTLPSDAADGALKPTETTKSKTDLEPAHLMYEDCESLKMEPGENVDLVVLTATNTHTIMVIPQKDIGLMEELETLSTALNEYCNSLKTVYYEPADGEVVLAKFSQDGLWYRAACLTTVPAEAAAIVQFVDYGNVETVLFDCLVQMLAAFVRPLPFLALHTVLEGSGAQPSSKERCPARLAELLPPFSCVTAARVSAQDPDTLTHAIALPHVLDTLRAEQLLE